MVVGTGRVSSGVRREMAELIEAVKKEMAIATGSAAKGGTNEEAEVGEARASVKVGVALSRQMARGVAVVVQRVAACHHLFHSIVPAPRHISK